MFSAPLDGRYAIQRELGTGGHARVYLAEDLKLGRAVAVKLLGPLTAGSEQENVQRLEREGRVASAINHPNVCAVSDIGRLPNGLPFLVLELLTGETLDARLEREGALPLAVALGFAEEMLLGLAAAHRLGIVHRDIKPANLFIVDVGHGQTRLKVLDFGIAQVPGGPTSDSATLTRTGLVVGTVEYMAPEQVRGLRSFDARTDVYAAGVVIYEMITGRRPFDGLPLDELCQSIVFKQAPPIASLAPSIAPPAARAIDLALSADINRRPGDAGAFLSALRAAALPVDDWSLTTHEASPYAKANVRAEANEWDIVTDRMTAEGAFTDEPAQPESSDALTIEVTFPPPSERRP